MIPLSHLLLVGVTVLSVIRVAILTCLTSCSKSNGTSSKISNTSRERSNSNSSSN